MKSRRAFLSKLAAGIVGVAVDPEVLAWRPGERSWHDLGGLKTYVRLEEGISIRFLKDYDSQLLGAPQKLDVLFSGGRM